MNVNNESPAALLPCPFCGGEAYLDRAGTHRVSCIVSCTKCGAWHESGDEGDRSGSSWNRRSSTAPGASESRGSAPDGFVLVPKEPTPEMIAEGRHCDDLADVSNVKRIYRAMLAAAPTPPAVSNGEPPDWAIAQAFRHEWNNTFAVGSPTSWLIQHIMDMAKKIALSRSAAVKENT